MIDRPVPLLLAGIALASAAIGGAWFSELGLGYVPCMLCLWQRIPYYVAAVPAIAVLALLASGRAPRATGWLALGLALIFLVSAGLGVFHAGVEWKLWAGPAGCGGRVELAAPSFQDFQKSLQKARVVLCDEAPMRVLGLSFAGWNAVASLLVSGLFARAAQLFRRV